jgi:hypothetical protein
MTMSMLLCSLSKAPEVLQVCWALVRESLHIALMGCLYFPKGDYDGDMVICIWQPSIVEQFSNADPKFMDPPTSLQDHFNIKNETVTEFLHRVPPTSPTNTQMHELQEVLNVPIVRCPCSWNHTQPCMRMPCTPWAIHILPPHCLHGCKCHFKQTFFVCLVSDHNDGDL